MDKTTPSNVNMNPPLAPAPASAPTSPSATTDSTPPSAQAQTTNQSPFTKDTSTPTKPDSDTTLATSTSTLSASTSSSWWAYAGWSSSNVGSEPESAPNGDRASEGRKDGNGNCEAGPDAGHVKVEDSTSTVVLGTATTQEMVNTKTKTEEEQQNVRNGVDAPAVGGKNFQFHFRSACMLTVGLV